MLSPCAHNRECDWGMLKDCLQFRNGCEDFRPRYCARFSDERKEAGSHDGMAMQTVQEKREATQAGS